MKMVVYLFTSLSFLSPCPAYLHLTASPDSVSLAQAGRAYSSIHISLGTAVAQYHGVWQHDSSSHLSTPTTLLTISSSLIATVTRSTMFTTQRLTLRPFVDEDMDHILALHNDASVQRFITDKPNVPHPPSYKIPLKSWAEKSTIWFTLILTNYITPKGQLLIGPIRSGTPYHPSGSFVGFSSISVHEPKNRDGFFVLALAKKFWGIGLGGEASRFSIDYAFRALGLQRMSLVVYEGNEAAIKLYRNLGFKDEGRKRRCNWVDGRWEDVLYMGVLDDEWDAVEKARMRTTVTEA